MGSKPPFGGEGATCYQGRCVAFLSILQRMLSGVTVRYRVSHHGTVFRTSYSTRAVCSGISSGLVAHAMFALARQELATALEPQLRPVRTRTEMASTS
jgi:hypothetical protein